MGNSSWKPFGHQVSGCCSTGEFFLFGLLSAYSRPDEIYFKLFIYFSYIRKSNEKCVEKLCIRDPSSKKTDIGKKGKLGKIQKE